MVIRIFQRPGNHETWWKFRDHCLTASPRPSATLPKSAKVELSFRPVKFSLTYIIGEFCDPLTRDCRALMSVMHPRDLDAISSDVQGSRMSMLASVSHRPLLPI